MRGIILAGGEGTRLRPLTKVTSKQLLPIYNKPMIYYPLQKLIDAGIKEILIIVAPDHCGDYMRVLGSGREFGVKFTYEIQDKPNGIAQAFILGETFIEGDDVTLILGDNLFDADIGAAIKSFHGPGATIFVKEVPDPERFGVVQLDDQKRPIKIIEKPLEFVSNLAVTGIYIYDYKVSSIAKQLVPSARGELEITDLNNEYLKLSQLNVETITGDWIDAGTFESYYNANKWAYDKR